MNQSQDRPILMCCLHCKKLLLIRNQFFSLLNENPNSITSSATDAENLQSKHNMIMNYDISESKQNISRISTAANILQSKNQSYFPLCKDCTAIFLNQIGYSIRIYQNTDKYLPNYLLVLSQNPHMFSQNLKHLLESEPDHNCKNNKQIISSDQSAQFDEMTSSHLTTKFESSSKSLESLPLLFTLPSPSPTFCPLMSYDAFFISFNRLYGTINGSRIGFYKYDVNTVQENNLALFQICHLIYYLKKAFNIPGIHIYLNSSAGIKLNSETTLNVLEVPSKKRSLLLGNFNTSLICLFTAYTLIEKATPEVDDFQYETYKVDLDEETIGNVSFLLDWKRLDEWSNAMRFLLINLKIIQCRSIISSI